MGGLAGQAGARRGRWSRRELLPAWGGDCCGRSWEPLPLPRPDTATQPERKKPGDRESSLPGLQREGSGQSSGCGPLGPRAAQPPLERPPGSPWPPALRSPAWPAHWPRQPPGGCGRFPRPAVCAAGHSWFSPVVTRARPGARRTGVHTWVHSPAGPLGPHTPQATQCPCLSAER